MQYGSDWAMPLATMDWPHGSVVLNLFGRSNSSPPEFLVRPFSDAPPSFYPAWNRKNIIQKMSDNKVSPVGALLSGRSLAKDAVEQGNYSLLNKFALCESKAPIKVSAAKDPLEVEFASNKFYALCGLGGILSCGITHTAIVPLDLVKCRIQVNPDKYKGVFNGFKVSIKEDGVRGLARGWAPTFIGYSMQGMFKFGLYEIFKVEYHHILGDENAYLYRTWLYLAASASAEFFADIALAPMEAVKVRIQTMPGFPTTLAKGFPKILAEEGLSGFYKGLVPLWMRQIPYTMMKFACFEKTVELLYKHVVPKPRAECSKGEQLLVTFAAGYIAGVFCAIVSHPADTVVSKLNQAKGSSALDVAKKLGFAGMWKGLTPRIIMIGTLTALQWFIYDAVKVSFHLPRPPPPEAPESLKLKWAAQGKVIQ
ncbi:Phosphate carrier protein, mitochondrial [Hypsibius exemplaris]|uniref:Phosphate carrier protein, mitochondrial n=1 Tax=Hypsibius exemplaris TaxID=2072580 RepID=A0A1W0X9M4_HYPEX|nr:Phosphate carrier protein, mitochondrial [Hypsibius exemplaris]